MKRTFAAVVLYLFAASASAAGLADITNKDAVSGLRQALTDGAAAAVGKLGVENGFFGNAKVKIPLPESLQKVEGLMRAMGMKRQADELELAMNRAAETAVAEAKPLLVDAVKKMSVQDAKGILTGGETSATDYFRRTTADALGKKFLPVVKKATAKVGLAEKYNSIAGKGAQLGLINADQATIEQYVTKKSLDGLYAIIADEEKALRQDPVGAASSIVQKVFGALR
ncbi:MAG: DUF4197 domain-containing protein [Betaproteobacteria bacterium]|nr:DUF4197 domain-containing protein [Betaproteobacteria bacterium]